MIRDKIDAKMKSKGHGTNNTGIEGKLPRGSPWFYPDDPLLSAISDREDPYCTPVVVYIWEYTDKDLRMTSCPYCSSPKHLSKVTAGVYKSTLFF